jgi:hypothetical protein
MAAHSSGDKRSLRESYGIQSLPTAFSSGRYFFRRSDVLSRYSLATVPFGSEAPLSRKYWDMIASVFNIPSL